MNILFLTISRIESIQARGIYTDLMRKFRNEGHRVYIVTPLERQFKKETSLSDSDGVHILGVKCLNIQKTNAIEKGIGTILLENQYKKAIKKYLSDISFDMVLYSTPPITFTNVVKYIKHKNSKAVSYLLLKDIFPQNAVDLGMFSKKSLFYAYFRAKEKALYEHSDYIGCMSPANVSFVLAHNPSVDPQTIEIAPNSIELLAPEVLNKNAIRLKYDLPVNKTLFIYGGNLGKPQGIDFLIACMDANANRQDCHFLIVGNGTEFEKLRSWYIAKRPQNITLLEGLPKIDYDRVVQSCDVGLIFLDYRFTIPNYPSRLLSYLEYRMPVLTATDSNTDMGSIAETNGFGLACISKDVNDFTNCLNRFVQKPEIITEMGNNGYVFLKSNYLVEHTYAKIVSHV